MTAEITVYDGCQSIGGNKIYLEFDGHGVFFDFGINYEKLGRFCEEFLAPRPGRGIHDYLHIGQLPHLNIYRDDLVPTDVDLSKFQKMRVDAVFLSHAHLDHVGRASMLDFKIPFVASPMTFALLKCLRDCDSHHIEHEVVYANRRTPGKNDRYLAVARSDPLKGRKLVIAGPMTNRFENFMTFCPLRKRFDSGELLKQEDVDIEFRQFDTDHSIYGSSAFGVNTSCGWIVYTGDLRMHGRFADKTKTFVNEARALCPRALIIEGTRIDATQEGITEKTVYETCLGASSDEKGLIVADFSPRNFERLDTFKRIAKELGRELVVLMKDAYCLDAISCVDGRDHMENVRVYRDIKEKMESYETEVETRHEEALIDPMDIALDPRKFIVCFSFWDMNRLLDIKPRGGTYIYSSSEAYTEEQAIDFYRLRNWLSLFGMKIRGFEIVEDSQGPRPKFDPGYHASGHAPAEDLVKIIDMIDPEVVIPVHTVKPERFSELIDREVLVPIEGSPIELSG
ncbi:MAG: MBL fold metallo-hydrolase RNA specificity domain-containing protein [Methanomassiliicoccales archaeon]|nr:MBL fold metallo-hydrolase RNA specificity domain-containing protein [Methanomassiliicoccales archaeon]